MKTSDSIHELAAALVKAQAAIGAVHKDKTGKIETKSGKGYEYNYADLASVIECVKKPLNDNGLAVIQCPGAATQGVIVTTMLLHTSGQWISEETFIPVAALTPQAYGSAITYGKRYGLQSMALLPSEDDDGKKGGEKDANAAAPERPNTATQTAKDAFEEMSDESKDWLRSHAATIQRMFPLGDLLGYINEQRFNTEEKLALWSLLPSDVRAAIKRQQSDEAAARTTKVVSMLPPLATAKDLAS